MKKVLLFSFLMIVIPTIIIWYFFRIQESTFQFSRNTIVRILRSKTGQIDEVPLEQYVIGVVAGEMPASFQEEALKAQAVASRSYVMYQILKNRKDDYDVIDTVLNQVYLDQDTLKQKWKDKYDVYYQKIVDAVASTSYEYIVYNGKIAEALFFSTSTGYTENSEDVFVSKVPYLRSVKSEWDKISPVFQEEEIFTREDFLKKLKLSNTSQISVNVIDSTKAGKIKEIQINEKTYTGKEIASLLGLRSSAFSIDVEKDSVTVSTKGYGHGVGMSQYGAEGMAQEGYSYDEILKYYYTGVELKKIKN